ncbi:MAG: hypothetical protein IMF06_02585, partial [Proteobacteria bacterium]|nr:hypothetical protein [Pseudomonadota bacterium]
MWVTTLSENYNWLGALVALVGIVVLTKVSKFFIFKVTALDKMRDINREQDKEKWKKPKYPPIVK